MLGTVRGTQWGYSLYEFELYGCPSNDGARISTSHLVTTKDTAKGLRLYPNPITDVLHLESSSELSSISITNLNGQVLKRQQVEGKELSFPVEGLNSGIYIVSLKFDLGNVVRRKIVVE